MEPILDMKMPKKKRTSASAMNATWRQICRLKRDHLDVGDFCLMTDTHNVWISEQPMGEPRKHSVAMTRTQFNKLIRWYTREHKFIRK